MEWSRGKRKYVAMMMLMARGCTKTTTTTDSFFATAFHSLSPRSFLFIFLRLFKLLYYFHSISSSATMFCGFFVRSWTFLWRIGGLYGNNVTISLKLQSQRQAFRYFWSIFNKKLNIFFVTEYPFYPQIEPKTSSPYRGFEQIYFLHKFLLSNLQIAKRRTGKLKTPRAA